MKNKANVLSSVKKWFFRRRNKRKNELELKFPKKFTTMSTSDKKGAAAPGSSQIYKETTVPLAVQPKNVIDTTEVSTPYSKKKQVGMSVSVHYRYK